MDLNAWLRFTLAPNLTLRHRLALLKALECPERIFAASPAELIEAAQDEKVVPALAQRASAESIDRAQRWLAQPNRHLVTMGSNAYPREWLGEIADPPVALYVEGRPELLSAPSIAIVGSRNATAQGARDAEALAHSLSDAGITIVSGLALGIDSAAHRGGLLGRGSSVAVMGTGADRIYPARNRSLADALARDGALVSEFPLGTPPLPGNFPQRNRLISGLSRGVLVVEAALQSGSLITARCAAEQNRDVFALPGSIHSPLAKGCHSLIKEGAKLVERAEDILDELGIAHEDSAPEVFRGPARRDPFLEAMGASPVSLDEIAERTGENAASAAARISLLELEGRVAAVAGGLFQRLQKSRVIE